MCTSLEATGYEVASFQDGDMASESLVKNHDYGLAVVDIMLPGKDGFALLPELKSIIDPEKRAVTREGQEISLKPMEFECLMMLVHNRNRELTRKQLLTVLWLLFRGPVNSNL
ncbi:response regulator [Enterocloster clostridioformis]|nr:response regulator [Enterocloster clostridioformis]